MDARDVALLQARGRIAVGVAMLAAPALAARGWIGDDSSRGSTKVLTRGFGGRDLALGLGVAIALDRGAPVRGWLEASALADVADFVATLLSRDAIPAAGRKGIAALAAGSALTAFALSRALEEPPAPVDTPEASLTGHPA
jgi:hypothetical protein